MGKFPIRPLSLAIVTGAALTTLASMPALALSCKSSPVVAHGHKAVLKNSTLVAARLKWRSQVIGKYGVIWAAYHLCAGKSETVSKSGLRWRARVSCRPCRL